MDLYRRIHFLLAGSVLASLFVLSGCATTATETKQRTVQQGLRTPEGTLMFTYSENTFVGSAIVNTEPGLLRCSVDGSGNVQDCTDHNIAYKLYQDWEPTRDRALYVYEDAEDPGPENRGVIECSSSFPLSDCQQRELTSNLEAGPGELVLFVSVPLREMKTAEVESQGFLGSLFGTTDERKQVDTDSDAEIYYPENTGTMQCRVTEKGLLADCRKLETDFESANASGEEA